MSKTIRSMVFVLTICVLSLTVSAQKYSPAENAALRYWQAFALMQDLPTSPEDVKELDAMVNGTQAWDEQKFGKLIDANDEALSTMHRATALPYCDWGLDIALGPNTPVAHIPKARVLARLNMLAGIRLAAQGHPQESIDTFIYGFRFAQHLSQDGTMLSVLVAKTALSAQMRAMIQVVATTHLDRSTLQKIAEVTRALPPYGFDWGRPMLTELQSNQLALRNVEGSQQTSAELQSVYIDAAKALRLPNTEAKLQLAAIQRKIASLSKLSQQMVPNLIRFNDARMQLESERTTLLESVEKQL